MLQKEEDVGKDLGLPFAVESVRSVRMAAEEAGWDPVCLEIHLGSDVDGRPEQ